MSYSVIGDWGTSRLRLFRIEQGQVVDRVEAAGIGAISTGRESPEAVLRAALAPWRSSGGPAHIALCGMIGSRNGWVEVPYVESPADARAWLAGAARLDLDGVPVAIMAGLACTTPAGAPDVMRGEETQIFGAITLTPALATGRHRIALPGTHSKWATVEDGRIVAFETFFTGEMFALLRDHSTLTRAGDASRDDPADETAGFADGVARAGSGDMLIGALFEARSAQLRRARSPGWALGFLSGLLIGREIVEATASSYDRLVLIGDPKLADRYRRAFTQLRGATGIETDFIDGDACALAGLNLLEIPS